ncbi:MAG TPA: hypothetical protein VK598_01110 [Nitrospiraceae bacterium]|nr:hypothetical protein [Nitrospiraceae bacterium]
MYSVSVRLLLIIFASLQGTVEHRIGAGGSSLLTPAEKRIVAVRRETLQ